MPMCKYQTRQVIVWHAGSTVSSTLRHHVSYMHGVCVGRDSSTLRWIIKD